MKIDLSREFGKQRWQPITALLFAMIVCAVIYWPGRHGPMLLDDFPQLGGMLYPSTGTSPRLRDLLISSSGPLGRPLAMLTFWLNSILTPGDLPAWKATNILIHLFCGLLAGLLAMELFAATKRDDATEPRYVGAFVGMIWLLHPLQVSTVLYTVQRMTELSALFTFAGLYAYIHIRRNYAGSPRHTITGLALLSAATLLATLCKENGVLLPILASAAELLVFRETGDTRVGGRIVKYYFTAFYLLVISTAGYILVLHPESVFSGYVYRGFTLTQRLLSEPRILFDYLAMILFPWPGHLGFFHDDVRLSTSLLQPPNTLLALIGLVLLMGSAWIVRKRFPLAALGIAIFLIGQSLESSLIALEPMFEHRNYLPDFGILMTLTELGSWLLQKQKVFVHAVIAGIVLLGLTALLVIRVTHWSSAFDLYQNALVAHPESTEASSGLAQLYLDAGRPQQALQVLAGRTNFGARLQRAYIQCKTTGTLPAADLISLSEEPLSFLDSYPVTGLTRIAILGIQNQCHFQNEAYSQLIDHAAAVQTTPPYLRYMLYIYSGYYHQRQQQIQAAIVAMKAAHRMSPDTPVPLILSARWLLQAGLQKQAAETLRLAQAIDLRFHAGFGNDIATLGQKITEAENKPH